MAMPQEIADRLLDLNRAFYDRFAQAFTAARAKPQPGFERLLDFLPQPCSGLLDVGCGNGRLGSYLLERTAVERYVGIDFSAPMMQERDADERLSFLMRDISQPGFLDGLGRFEAIACLAALQHIPGKERRAEVMAEMSRHLALNGRLLISTWQFLDNSRQRKKIVDWSSLGLSNADVDPGDYLLTWQRGGLGLRYVAFLDAAEMQRLAQLAGLEVIAQYRSDGREGNLNLYTVCSK